MIEFIGERVGQNPFCNATITELIKLGSIPVLCKLEFDGSFYIAHWCDCESFINRWLIVPTDEKAIEELIQRKLPLHEILTRNNKYYIVDDFSWGETLDNGHGLSVLAVTKDDIPEDYFPDKGEMI